MIQVIVDRLGVYVPEGLDAADLDSTVRFAMGLRASMHGADPHTSDFGVFGVGNWIRIL
jgi:hypothetical protein